MSVSHYEGSCQCGEVTYAVAVDLEKTITCNCSRCQRMGFVLSFAPLTNFQLKSGESNLTEFRFNRKTVCHLFCKTCGVEGFAYGEQPDGSKVVAINANCLAGVEPRALNAQAVDGRSF